MIEALNIRTYMSERARQTLVPLEGVYIPFRNACKSILNRFLYTKQIIKIERFMTINHIVGEYAACPVISNYYGYSLTLVVHHYHW